MPSPKSISSSASKGSFSPTMRRPRECHGTQRSRMFISHSNEKVGMVCSGSLTVIHATSFGSKSLGVCDYRHASESNGACQALMLQTLCASLLLTRYRAVCPERCPAGGAPDTSSTLHRMPMRPEHCRPFDWRELAASVRFRRARDRCGRRNLLGNAAAVGQIGTGKP